MNKVFFLILMSASTAAVASTPVDLSRSNACVYKMANAGSAYGIFEGNTGAFYVSPEGKTEVLDQKRIVSRENKDGVETIVYKAQEPRLDKEGRQFVMETVKRTVQIKRENGKVVSINKLWDVQKQIQDIKNARANCPKCLESSSYVKSMESTFSHDGNNCDVNQETIYLVKDANSEAEAKLTYDKKLCDTLAPMVQKMGSQNAAQCGDLLLKARFAYDKRAKELEKDNKSFFSMSQKIKNGNDLSLLDLSGKIAACTLQGMPAEYGMGFSGYGGVSGGYGSGMMMGSGMMGAPASKATKNQAKPPVEGAR